MADCKARCHPYPAFPDPCQRPYPEVAICCLKFTIVSTVDGLPHTSIARVSRTCEADENGLFDGLGNEQESYGPISLEWDVGADPVVVGYFTRSPSWFPCYDDLGEIVCFAVVGWYFDCLTQDVVFWYGTVVDLVDNPIHLGIDWRDWPTDGVEWTTSLPDGVTSVRVDVDCANFNCESTDCFPVCISSTYGCSGNADDVIHPFLFIYVDYGTGTSDGQIEYDDGTGQWGGDIDLGDCGVLTLSLGCAGGLQQLTYVVAIDGVPTYGGSTFLTLECDDGEVSWTNVFTDTGCELDVTIFSNNAGAL